MNSSPVLAEAPLIVEPAHHAVELIAMGTGALAAGVCVAVGVVGVVRMTSESIKRARSSDEA